MGRLSVFKKSLIKNYFLFPRGADLEMSFKNRYHSEVYNTSEIIFLRLVFLFSFSHSCCTSISVGAIQPGSAEGQIVQRVAECVPSPSSCTSGSCVLTNVCNEWAQSGEEAERRVHSLQSCSQMSKLTFSVHFKGLWALTHCPPLC